MKKIIGILISVIWISNTYALLDIKPYGNLFVFLGYNQLDTYTSGQEKQTDRDTVYSINNNSNLGFNFKYNGKVRKYTGVFELGISDESEDWQVKVRKAYGAYENKWGKLLIGQNWSPYVHFSHEMANYYRSEGFGSMYEHPTVQLQFTFKWGMYIDILKPYTASDVYFENQNVDNPDAATDASNQEYQVDKIEREITTKQKLENIQSMIPKIAIGYTYKHKLFNVSTGIAGNLYKIADTVETKYNKDWIISYLAYLHTSVTIQRKYFINFNGGFLVNPANYGISVQSKGNTTYYPGAAASIYNIATDKYEIKDTWNIQSYLELGWKIKSSLMFFLGSGFSLVDYPMINTEQDLALEFFMNLKINVGGLIALTPSLSYIDYMEDMSGNEEGSEIKIGVLATVSFY